MSDQKRAGDFIWINHIYLDTALWSSGLLPMVEAVSNRKNKIQLVVPSVSKEKRRLLALSYDVKYLFTIRTPYPATMTFPFLVFFYLIGVSKRNFSYVVADPPSLLGTLGMLLFSRKTKFILDIRSPPVLDGVRGFLERVQYHTAIVLARRLYDGITVTSAALKQDMTSRFKMDPELVGVWTSGVSLDLFDPKRYIESSKRLRKELSLENKFIVMYHGSYREDLLEVIDAIGKLVPTYNDIVFFILGGGLEERERKLKLSISKNKIDANVCFHGVVDHERVPLFIAMCDIGIIPLGKDYWHGSALKLFEYLAMEKPIIATDLPFHREVFHHGNCGILISTNNSEKLVSAIEEFYCNRKHIQSMGKTGRNIVEQYYSWDALSRNFETFIRRLR